MKDFFSSKLAVVLLALALVFLARLKYQQYRDGAAILKAKQELVQQQEQEESKNRQLSQSLRMLNDPAVKEKIARSQLNMKKEGELVFNFTERAEPDAPAPQADSNLSNPQKWWNYFFKQ